MALPGGNAIVMAAQQCFKVIMSSKDYNFVAVSITSWSSSVVGAGHHQVVDNKRPALPQAPAPVGREANPAARTS